MIIYTVKAGDTLYSIGERFGTQPAQIAADNGIELTTTLVVGQALAVLTGSVSYTIEQGDTLYNIAARYETTVFAIIDANLGVDPSNLQVGQQIIIPSEQKTLGSMEVNGYAFPSITNGTLEKVLSSLSYMSIFSYQVRADGTLIPPDDARVIEMSKRYRTAPMMVVTNIKQGASFDSDLVHSVLSDMSAQTMLIESIVWVLDSKGYFGVDIDFEYIYPTDRESYNMFLQRLVRRLRPLGYTVSTALAPKTKTDQKGLLYEAHDYAAHGSIVDHVIIMTYEWGYTYGEPMAVAPLNQVEQVVRYAVSQIPNQKILMGIPNYGYDWTLPFVQGTAARTISNTEAVALAARVGAQIEFDTKAASPYFNYYDDEGKQHIVWFEDARSIDAKLRLAHKYELGGVSYWTVNRYFAQGFTVQNALFDTVRLM